MTSYPTDDKSRSTHNGEKHKRGQCCCLIELELQNDDSHGENSILANIFPSTPAMSDPFPEEEQNRKGIKGGLKDIAIYAKRNKPSLLF